MNIKTPIKHSDRIHLFIVGSRDEIKQIKSFRVVPRILYKTKKRKHEKCEKLVINLK